jgi:DNA-binding transcriptional regulator YiaG
VRRRIQETLSSYRVKSAIAYELFGVHDLMLRVWLPEEAGLEDFQQAMTSSLRVEGLSMCDPFQVRNVVRHWLFKGDGATRIGLFSPTGQRRVSREEIAAVESGDEQLLGQLDNAGTVSRFPASPDPLEAGTKFSVVVTGDARMTTREQAELQSTLVNVLDQTERHGRIDQCSLYSGWGFGHFVVGGRVKPGHGVHVLTEDLLPGVYERKVRLAFNSRTYSHVHSHANMVLSYESLVDPIPPPPQEDGDEDEDPAFVGPRAEPPSWPRVGKAFLDRFEIESAIASSDTSAVFAAVERNDGRRCALKAFKTDRAYDAVRRETNILRKSEHPNLVEVSSLGRTPGGIAYMVSELVTGDSLSECMRSASLSPDQAADAVLQLLSALEQIHPDEGLVAGLESGDADKIREFAELQELLDGGCVHGDIRPAKILLDGDTVKLLPFGAGSRVDDPTRGIAYRAPDARGVGWDVSADLFASGVLLYTLVCGQHPYPDSRPSIVQEPRDPRELRDDIPVAMANFLRRACRPSRADRFASAREMRAQLMKALEQGQLDVRAQRPELLGERVKALREANGMTRAALAARTGINVALLTSIEAGGAAPTVPQTAALAEGLGMTLFELLGGDG